MAVRNKQPSLLVIMYHVFIGSLLKILCKILSKIGNFIKNIIHKFFITLVKFLHMVVTSPLALARLLKSKFARVEHIDLTTVETKLKAELPFFKKISLLLCKLLGNTWWHIKHQLALTSIDEIRSLDKKPFFSFGWELWSEFNPRHKLDFWMADSHITVEICKFKYDHKKNKLYYVEHGSKKSAHVHSPHGVPHIVNKVHWWEPVIESTVRPYTPLHTLNQTEN